MSSNPPFSDNHLVLVNNARALAIYLESDYIYYVNDKNNSFIFIGKEYVLFSFSGLSPHTLHSIDTQQIFAE